MFLQRRGQELAGVGTFYRSDLFRRTGGYHLASAVAAFRTQVDDPVGGFDHVEIMFNDDYGITVIPQTVQDVQ